MTRIKMQNTTKDYSIKETFDRYLTAVEASGATKKTISSYNCHFRCLSKHIDMEMPIKDLSKDDLYHMNTSLRKSNLSHNSICSYTRVMRAFLNWCHTEGYTYVSMQNIKPKETVKETYTDEELLKLLKKPENDCSFCEYRNWVIIHFLLNSGCRASTIRNILIGDLDLAGKQVTFRHTKTGEIQVIPLCSSLVPILKDYLKIRKGENDNFLFCNEYGEMLTENALSQAIAHYNKRRGVEKTSIHAFRHTFARKYLIDCGGNAFTLQKILGHSTLEMTKHYCAIFDTDLINNYDSYSPLAQIMRGKEKLRK